MPAGGGAAGGRARRWGGGRRRRRGREVLGAGLPAAVVAAVVAAVTVGGCGRGGSLGYLAPEGGRDGRSGLGLVHASVSAALRAEYRGQAARRPPPVSLVPADGGELELRALEGTVTIEGPLAHTELRLVFHNPEARVREGRFSIALPPEAAIARFAMRVEEGWRESRVVTRARGREVYERFLHRGVDPALLEQGLGNELSARVFPIAAGADKELVVAYDHQVSAERPYVLALEGLPAVPALTVRIARDGEVSAIERAGAAPEDVIVPIAGGSDAVACDDAFVARIDPAAAGVAGAAGAGVAGAAGAGVAGAAGAGVAGAAGAGVAGTAAAGVAGAALDRVLVLVDTSASRAPVMGRQVELVRGLVAALPAEAAVAIAAFDHGVDELYRGRAGDAGAAAAALFDHGALGASDLGGALRRAAASGMARVVLVGDGAPTLGEHEPARLAAIVRGSPIARLDAIQVGRSLDRDTLAALVAAGREPGAILDGRDPAHAARQLAAALPREEPIRVDGAAASFPATTRGLAPGEPIWVAGRRLGGGPLVVRIGGRAIELTPRRADPDRVRRAAARAEIAALTEQLARPGQPAERESIGARIESLALVHHLVSARTSLLVLESDDDERRMLTPDERGERGERGEHGERGARGEPGEPAAGPGGPMARSGAATSGAGGGSAGEDRSRAGGGGGARVGGGGRSGASGDGEARGGAGEVAGQAARIPVGRTFASVMGSAAGAAGDGTGGAAGAGGAGGGGGAQGIDEGEARTGATLSDEELVALMGAEDKGSGAELCVVTASAPTSVDNSYFVGGVGGDLAARDLGLAPLALEIAVERMRVTAAPFGMPRAYRAISDEPAPAPAYTGELGEVMAALARRDRDAALERATRWQLANPGDVAAVLALGESLEARGAAALAARAYGSLIDLFPTRAELLRAAGERLDRVAAADPAARALAIDAYRRALRERPDQVSTYRLLAYALLRAGRGDEAIDVLGAGLARATRPSVTEILAADAGVIAAHLVARDPGKRRALAARMRRGIADRPSLRIVLSWETDANDVDLHVRDRAGGHAYFSARRLPSGGELLDDLTDGYGPEMFVVDAPAAFPYRVAAHYYRRGPMGVGLGSAQVIRHDGAGNVTVEDRPFAIQNDGAMIDLGAIAR